MRIKFFIILLLLLLSMGMAKQNLDEYNIFYDNGDGTYTHTVSTAPINYYNGSAYDEVNTTIITPSTKDGYESEVTKSMFKAYFKEYADNPSFFRLEYENDWVNITLNEIIGVSKVKTVNSTKDKNKIKYDKVFDADTYVEYEVLATGVKESLVLEKKPACSGNLTVRSILDYDSDLTLFYEVTAWDESSTVTADYLTLNNGTNEFLMPQPFANDSTGDLYLLNYTLSNNGTHNLLDINVPCTYTDAASYNVVIDPSILITTGNVTRDTYVSNLNKNTNYGTLGGYYAINETDGGSPLEYRVYGQIDISDISDHSIITNAILYPAGTSTHITYLHEVYDDTWDGQSETTIVWNNQVCGTAFDDAGDCNLTYEYAAPIGDNNYTATEMTKNSQTDDLLSWALLDAPAAGGTGYWIGTTKEGAGGATLNVTYTRYNITTFVCDDPMANGSSVTCTLTANTEGTGGWRFTVCNQSSGFNGATGNCDTGITYCKTPTFNTTNPKDCIWTANFTGETSKTLHGFLWQDDDYYVNKSDTVTITYNDFDPVFSVEPSDQQSTDANRTAVPDILTLLATATDGDGDDYYLIGCSTNSTTGGSCTATEYCRSAANVTSGTQNTCPINTTGLTQVTYDWFVFACDDQTTVRCSIGENGTGDNGSPLYLNQPPPTPNITHPPNYDLHQDTIIPLNWTIEVDPNGDDVTYEVQLDNETGFNTPLILDVTGLTNNSILTPPLVSGQYYVRVRARDNTSYSNNVSDWHGYHTFIIAAWSEPDYDALVQDNTETTFVSVVYAAPSQIVTGSWIEWNGTEYTMTATPDGTGNWTLQSTIPVPDIPEYNQTVFFHFHAELNGTLNETSPTYNQTVYSAMLLPCSNTSVGTIPVLNFTFYDEETLSNMNASAEATFWVYNAAHTTEEEESFNITNQGYYEVCLYPPNATLYVDSWQVHTAPDYPLRSYFLQNRTVSNITAGNISIYLTNNTYGYLITAELNDMNRKGVDDAYIQFLRYYPAENEYRLVAMSKTDDFGLANTYLRPNDIWYRIIVYKDYQTLSSFSPQTIGCDPAFTACSLLLSLSPSNYIEYFDYVNDVGVACTFNTSGLNQTVCTVTDESGLMKWANMKIIQTDLFSHSTVCDITSTSSPAILICNMGNVTGEYSRTVVAHFTDVYPLWSDIMSFVTGTPTLLGDEGLIIGALIVITAAGIGMFHPGVAFFMGGIGLTAASLFGLIEVDKSAIVGILVISILFLIIMYKRGD